MPAFQLQTLVQRSHGFSNSNIGCRQHDYVLDFPPPPTKHNRSYRQSSVDALGGLPFAKKACDSVGGVSLEDLLAQLSKACSAEGRNVVASAAKMNGRDEDQCSSEVRRVAQQSTALNTKEGKKGKKIALAAIRKANKFSLKHKDSDDDLDSESDSEESEYEEVYPKKPRVNVPRVHCNVPLPGISVEPPAFTPLMTEPEVVDIPHLRQPGNTAAQQPPAATASYDASALPEALQRQIDEIRAIVEQNIALATANREQVEALHHKAEGVKFTSKVFKKKGKQLKQHFWKQNATLIIVIALIVLAVFIVIAMLVGAFVAMSLLMLL